MSYYIGIDLGTTNSAICSYDGQNVRIWKRLMELKRKKLPSLQHL